MTKVSQATVDTLKSRSKQENLRLLNSGTLNAEQAEAVRRFYPTAAPKAAPLTGRTVVSTNGKRSSFTGQSRSRVSPNIKAAAQRRVATTNAPGQGKKPSPVGPGSPWQRFQKSGGMKNITDTKGKGSPWQQFVKSRNEKNQGKSLREQAKGHPVTEALDKVTGHSERQATYAANKEKARRAGK